MRQMATRTASGSSSGLQFRIDDAIGIEAVASSRKRLPPHANYGKCTSQIIAVLDGYHAMKDSNLEFSSITAQKLRE